MRKLLPATAQLLLVMLFSSATAAEFRVPAGATLDLGGGTVNFAGTDFISSGTVRLGSGQLLGARDFRVLDGVCDLGSGVLRLTGSFENLGTLVSGTSRVELRDGAMVESMVLGNSTFATLSLASSSGKRYRLSSGSTQRVTTQLEIVGTGAPLQIDVTAAGSVAFLDLLGGGTQNIANIGVSDVHAIGQMLATGQNNEGGNGNDQGWFGNGPTPVPPLPSQPEIIPSLSDAGLLLLALLFVAIAWLRTIRMAAN